LPFLKVGTTATCFQEYVRRLRLILNTELRAKNKMQAIESLAVPVLRYSFGIIEWHQEEIKKTG
jgi:hypothetical protein